MSSDKKGLALIDLHLIFEKSSLKNQVGLFKDPFFYNAPEINLWKATLQSLTGRYRGLQGNPCNENRDPAMRTGVSCNENRFFPVRIDLQGVPCKPYRVWVCGVFT